MAAREEIVKVGCWISELATGNSRLTAYLTFLKTSFAFFTAAKKIQSAVTLGASL